MAVEYTQDSRFTVRSSFEKPPIGAGSRASHSHLRRRSKGFGTHHSRAGSLFDLVHGKERSKMSDKPHIEVHGEDVPITVRHLIKRPSSASGFTATSFTARDERKPSQFELVFDLIFVAVVNGLGHATAESSSAINVLKFALSFWPCFSLWTDVRLFLNTSGTDDMLERLLMLGWMILLGGYCANVSGVGADQGHARAAGAAAQRGGDGRGTFADECARYRSRARVHLPRAASADSAGAEEVKLAVPAFGGYWFTEGYNRAIHAAIGFFLVSKLWRLGIYIYYGFCLPKFERRSGSMRWP